MIVVFQLKIKVERVPKRMPQEVLIARGASISPHTHQLVAPMWELTEERTPDATGSTHNSKYARNYLINLYLLVVGSEQPFDFRKEQNFVLRVWIIKRSAFIIFSDT